MTWFGGPIVLAGLGLPVPALLCLAGVLAIRLTRSLALEATIYVAVFLAVGIAAS